jgi:hypothetical protein
MASLCLDPKVLEDAEIGSSLNFLSGMARNRGAVTLVENDPVPGSFSYGASEPFELPL